MKSITDMNDVPIWLSKWITDTGPHLSNVDRNAESVVVWSPPRVIIRGVLDRDEEAANREDADLCAWSSVLIAALLSSQVMGASPQSIILAQSFKGSLPIASRNAALVFVHV